MLDNLSPEDRKKAMKAVKSQNTSIEIEVESILRRLRLKYEKNVSDLPGRPDFVFRRKHVAIFVDGDFWHGWRFPSWRHKMGIYWQQKIDRNRRRDQRNMSKLRRQGWTVIRVWEHQVKRDRQLILERVEDALGRRKAGRL
jgi:DNA mismatch endonuclease, patch repair protein